MRKNETPRDRDGTSAQALLREVGALGEELHALRDELRDLTDRMPEGVQPASPAFARQVQAEREWIAAQAAENKRRAEEGEKRMAEEFARYKAEVESRQVPDHTRAGQRYTVDLEHP